MTNEHGAGASIPNGAISMLERATHFPTVLLLLSFILALDTGLSLGYRGGLLYLSWDFVQQHITIGHGLIFLFIFGLYMSVGVVFIRHFADHLAWNTVGLLWDKLFPRNAEHSQRLGTVSLFKLREAAHVEQNEFYLDLYNEHKRLQSKMRDNEWRISSTAFACLFLGVFNYLVLPYLGYPSFSSQIVTDFPGTWGWGFGGLSAFLLSVWLHPLLRDAGASDRVYCLSLYRKLEEERKKKQEILFPPRH